MTEKPADKYRAAVARLGQVAGEEFICNADMREAVEAMRAGSILPPAQLVAAAFLPDVGRPVLRRFAELAMWWVCSERMRQKGEADMPRAEEAARRTWCIETSGMWSPDERAAAMTEACAASSAARMVAESEMKRALVGG